MSLADFLARVALRVDEAISHPSFHPDQTRLLTATVEGPRGRGASDPLGDPLSLVYLIARAHGRTMDAQAEHLGAFCLLYILSLDLFDDVQDDDLAGKPHEEAGTAIAINSAIALGFLAVDQLRQAMDHERDPRRRAALLSLYNRVSLEAVGGQHRDLLGTDGASSPEEVLGMQQAKTSSVALLAECGALLGGCDEGLSARYRHLGERMALFIQIRDDLRDIFGKTLSADLATGKVTYPVACLLRDADEATRQQFFALLDELPDSMQALRKLVYRSGAVEESAAKLEDLREEMHATIAAINGPSAHHRMILDVIDGLAESVYAAMPIAATEPLRRPRGGFHDEVVGARDRFVARMAPLGLPEPPALRPWHLPHFMYVPSRGTIFYPDLEELAEEIVPFQAWLLGSNDLEAVVEVMRSQLPLVLAHEMFHFWRDACGRLSADHWHEEWAANHLAIAYARRHEREALAAALLLADRVIARFPEALGPAGCEVLARCDSLDPAAQGYGMDMISVAVVTLEMVRRLAAQEPDLLGAIDSLLENERKRAINA